MSNETYNSYLDAEGLALVLSGIRDKINTAAKGITNTKGKANGIASLDAGGNVPLSQLGNLDTTFFEIVTELPTDIRNIKKHIYILKDSKEGENNKYAEYIYTGDLTDPGDLAGEVDASNWEKLGDFVPSFDLQEYVKKAGAVAKLEFYDPVWNNVWNDDDDQPSETAIRIEFADGSHKYLVVPSAVAPTNTSRSNSELSDSEKSKPFISPGRAGFMSAGDKEKLDKIDVDALTASINAANTAADNTNKAIKAAETATAGAEKVNAELEGNVLTVTNRKGEVKSLDFEQWDLEEKVNITISTSVEGVSAKGIVVNVFLNGATTSTKYTSDTEGKVSFTVPRGTIYKISFQELKNCDPLPSLTYTAALRVRDINVEYKALSGETASVVVTIDKMENGAVKPLQGVSVTCEVANGDTTTTETNENGNVTFSIPWGKSYKITAGKLDGYYAFRGIYEKNNVADVAEYNLYYHFFPTTSGVFILDTAGEQYTLDEWQESGKTAEDAALVKITTQNLAEHNGNVGFSPSALQTGYPSKQWCTQNIQFNNIPLNGSNTKDALYYDGYKASKLIREEAEERGLSIPAFSYAYDCTVEIAEEVLHGYVASLGQMYEMDINKAIVDEVVMALYGANAKLFSQLFTQSKWTSTQYNIQNAWNYNSSANNIYQKPNSYVVLPVFAC